MPKAQLPDDRYLNRELSWLEFNARVLSLAERKDIPLLERLTFLAISDANLKEFYMVRVAGLRGQHKAGVTEKSFDGATVERQLACIHEKAKQQIDRQALVWKDLKDRLAGEDIHVVPLRALSVKDCEWADHFFAEQIFPLLTPLAVDPAHPFPFLPNLGFSMVLELQELATKKRLKALLPIHEKLKRFILLPTQPRGGKVRFIMIEDLMVRYFERLFPGFKVMEHGLFSLIRDSEVNINEDAEDLVRHYETALKKRRRGNVIRLIVNKGMSKRLKDFVTHHLNVSDADFFERDSLLAIKDARQIVDAVNRPDLCFVPFNPRFPERVRDFGGDGFAAIRNKDMLVHHPYESFDIVVQFLRQAAHDPNVLSIKQTLYRTSDDSPVVRALMEAAEAGKSVTALVELGARFDEEANIRWARDMERAGIQVVYGFLKLKTHAKISLVVRREGQGLQSYVHFGTGNYNPNTARMYTDLSFFTCDPVLCRDAARLFNYVTGYAMPERVEAVSYSPKRMRQKLLELIRKEMDFARKGKPAQIWAKMNALVDPDVIDALYRASQAGVEIDLVVRGICCLRPQVKGLSDNIRVKSLLGRFLEHSRIFCFGNGHGLPHEKSLVFLSSADWMPRNFDWRVEVMVPLRNETVRQQVQEQIMQATLMDQANSWELRGDGSYRPLFKEGASKQFSAHQYFLDNPSLSGRGTAHHLKALPPKLKV